MHPLQGITMVSLERAVAVPLATILINANADADVARVNPISITRVASQ
jgi:hypothetical protein